MLPPIPSAVGKEQPDDGGCPSASICRVSPAVGSVRPDRGCPRHYVLEIPRNVRHVGVRADHRRKRESDGKAHLLWGVGGTFGGGRESYPCPSEGCLHWPRVLQPRPCSIKHAFFLGGSLTYICSPRGDDTGCSDLSKGPSDDARQHCHGESQRTPEGALPEVPPGVVEEERGKTDGRGTSYLTIVRLKSMPSRFGHGQRYEVHAQTEASPIDQP